MSSMYTLTAMTGKEASANRTIVIGTIEFNWRVWMILLWTAPVALFATVLAWPLLGQVSIVMLPIVEGAAIFLIHRRTSHGLKLRTYQALWDKKKADLNTFMLCAQKIEVNESDYRVLMENTAPYVPPPPAPADALLDTLLARPVPAGVTPVAALDRRPEAAPAHALQAPAETFFAPPAIARPNPAAPVAAAPEPDLRIGEFGSARTDVRVVIAEQAPAALMAPTVAPAAPQTYPAPPTPVTAAPAAPARPGMNPLDRDLIGRETDPNAVDVNSWFDSGRQRHRKDAS